MPTPIACRQAVRQAVRQRLLHRRLVPRVVGVVQEDNLGRHLAVAERSAPVHGVEGARVAVRSDGIVAKHMLALGHKIVHRQLFVPQRARVTLLQERHLGALLPPPAASHVGSRQVFQALRIVKAAAREICSPERLRKVCKVAHNGCKTETAWARVAG